MPPLINANDYSTTNPMNISTTEASNQAIHYSIHRRLSSMIVCVARPSFKPTTHIIHVMHGYDNCEY